MFNYSSFVSDLNQRQLEPSQVGLGHGNTAKIYFFTPSAIPTQILRSYKYDFNDALISDLLDAGNMSEAMSPSGKGISSPQINRAILPTLNGVPLDMSNYSNQYTFVLIVDTEPIAHPFRRESGGPDTRLIATGYCIDEPINMMTNTCNENCVLCFTRSNLTRVQLTHGPNRTTMNIANTGDVDIVNELNSQLSQEALYVGCPGDIRQLATSANDGTFVGVYGDLALNHVKPDTPSRQIPGMIKTPKIQLGNIVHSLEKGISYAELHESGDLVDSDVSGITATRTPYELARDSFNCNVMHSQSHFPTRSLDVSRPMMLGTLMMLFQNDIDVIPYRIPQQVTWDVYPQEKMTKRNMMCAMISASLSNLVPTCGLSHIMFRYDSFHKPSIYASESEGSWKFEQAGTLVECDERKQLACIEQFKMYLESELFPIIFVIGGHFTLMAYVNVTGEILLDLIYNDDTEQLQPGEGMYTTSARLGGLTNPMVAPLEILNHNATELNDITDKVLFQRCGGQSLFNKPLIESIPQNTNPYAHL